MMFNVSYFGPERLFNLRRDFFLLIKYGLESLGHEVVLSASNFSSTHFNIIVGGYFLSVEQMQKIIRSGAPYAVLNTEIVKNGLLNYKAEKTDLINGYLPLIRGGRFSWDVVPQNIPELKNEYGIDSHFLRWAYHERLEDIDLWEKPDLDYYFFGFVTDRRKRLLDDLHKVGLVGTSDHSCPYFVRNDRIARAKVQINIRQEWRYVHVNAFRIGYLANNRTAILSEPEEDPTDYLAYAQVADKSNFAEAAADLVYQDNWKKLREESYERYKQISFNTVLEEVLDSSFATAA